MSQHTANESCLHWEAVLPKDLCSTPEALSWPVVIYILQCNIMQAVVAPYNLLKSHFIWASLSFDLQSMAFVAITLCNIVKKPVRVTFS